MATDAETAAQQFTLENRRNKTANDIALAEMFEAQTTTIFFKYRDNSCLRVKFKANGNRLVEAVPREPENR